MFARHPKTTFVALHVGHNAENLAYVSECLDKFPNMHVEIGARIGELGRQPRTARRFFDRYQDRILFGTDAVPHGTQTPQQIFGDAAVPDLLPVPRDRGRVFRLRARTRTPAGTLADLRNRTTGGDPAEGLQRERRAVARNLSLKRGTLVQVQLTRSQTPNVDLGAGRSKLGVLPTSPNADPRRICRSPNDVVTSLKPFRLRTVPSGFSCRFDTLPPGIVEVRRVGHVERFEPELHVHVLRQS